MRAMLRLSLVVFCGLAWAGAAIAQESAEPSDDASNLMQDAVSVETSLVDAEDCAIIGADESGELMSCTGLSGYGVLKAVTDDRTSVFYGYVGNWYAEGAYESFESINRIAEAIEWRVLDDVPYATIARWFIDFGMTESGETDPDAVGEMIVISRVAQPGEGEGCVVGYVDALENADAIEIARTVADTLALQFACRLEEPALHGEEGVLAGFPVRTFSP